MDGAEVETAGAVPAHEGVRVAAGPIVFVVEHRRVAQDGLETSGPTIRVLGASDGHEYLRFDMFDVGPHYHYEPPGTDQRVLPLDIDAEGEPATWAIGKLRTRLAPMLIAAGGRDLAEALEASTLTPAIDQIEALIGA